MYNQQRSDERVAFRTTCVLNINGNQYKGLLDNISDNGALIALISSHQDRIHQGDTGTLQVLLLSPVTYRCRVVRIKGNEIAVEFIDHSSSKAD